MTAGKTMCERVVGRPRGRKHSRDSPSDASARAGSDRTLLRHGLRCRRLRGRTFFGSRGSSQDLSTVPERSPRSMRAELRGRRGRRRGHLDPAVHNRNGMEIHWLRQLHIMWFQLHSWQHRNQADGLCFRCRRVDCGNTGGCDCRWLGRVHAVHRTPLEHRNLDPRFRLGHFMVGLGGSGMLSGGGRELCGGECGNWG